jgi:diaminopropionate ammonia-lyase
MEPRFATNPQRSREQDSNRLNFPRAFHVRLDGYSPTPLLDLPDLARDLGVARVWLKDESRRYQMHSFELLGTAWALYRDVLGRLGRRVRWETIDELVAAIAPIGPLRIIAVSDNELGVAAARAAALFGYPATIYVPGEMAAARLAAIEGEGAQVVAVPGGYDAALAMAATETGDDTVVLSDSSWGGFEEIPTWVTEGYATIFEEAVDEIERRKGPSPTAVIVPLGSGALAAAAGTYFRVEKFDADLWLVGVEPADTPCFVESAAVGRRVAMPDPGASAMTSLARGLPSPLAWDTVSATFDAFVAVDDARATEAIERLAASGVVVSASGAAALAGALDLVARRDAGDAGDAEVPLGPDASVLLVATEAPR